MLKPRTPVVLLQEPLHANRVSAVLEPASSEEGPLLVKARREAESIRNEARREAEAIVASAHAERDRVLQKVGSEAALHGQRLNKRPVHPATLVHSSEISTHMFRRSFRGLDAEAVCDWLAVVEASYAALEDELDRLRSGWDEMLIASARMRFATSAAQVSAQDPWRSVARSIASSRPNAKLLESDTSIARDALAGPPRGRRRTQKALTAAGVQLARMQHDAALLQWSNEQLRSQLLDTLAEACER